MGAPVETDESACVVTPVPFEVVDEESLAAIAAAIDEATTKNAGMGQECLEFKGFGARCPPNPTQPNPTQPNPALSQPNPTQP